MPCMTTVKSRYQLLIKWHRTKQDTRQKLSMRPKIKPCVRICLKRQRSLDSITMKDAMYTMDWWIDVNRREGCWGDQKDSNQSFGKATSHCKRINYFRLGTVACIEKMGKNNTCWVKDCCQAAVDQVNILGFDTTFLLLERRFSEEGVICTSKFIRCKRHQTKASTFWIFPRGSSGCNTICAWSSWSFCSGEAV